MGLTTMKIIGIFFFVVLANFSLAKKDFTGDQVLTLYPETERQVDIIRKLGERDGLVDFWSPDSGDLVRVDSAVDIQFPRVQLDELKALMDNNEIEYKIKIHDVQSLIENQVKGRKDAKRSLTHNYNVYHPLEEIYEWVDDIANEYPDLVTKSILGNSYEGREIPMLTITKDINNPVVFIDCTFHAREWISPAVCQCFTRNLLQGYGKDPIFTRHLDRLTFYVIPVVNVDGYAYSWLENRMWRKTRSNYGTICDGVDPNRNSNANFGGQGSSGNSCDNTYRGPAMESEIEVHNWAEHLRSVANKTMIYLSFHSYSQLIVLPHSYTFDITPTIDVLEKYAKQAATALGEVFGTVYTYGQGSSNLYLVSGGSKDYAYDIGIPWTCTFELRDTGYHGFLLPEDQIEPSCVETTAAVKKLSDAALELWYNRNL
ncbi:carboxypeptidase B-like [Styela clava]